MSTLLAAKVSVGPQPLPLDLPGGPQTRSPWGRFFPWSFWQSRSMSMMSLMLLSGMILAIVSTPHCIWSLSTKSADVLKAFKVKIVAFCLLPLRPWLCSNNGFSRWPAGRRAPSVVWGTLKLCFTCSSEPITECSFLSPVGEGGRANVLWLWLWIRTFLKTICGMTLLCVPKSFKVEGIFPKNSWINLLVPIPF